MATSNLIERFGPQDRAITAREAAKITSLSVPEIYRRLAAGEDFPRPFAIGPKRRAFMLSSVMHWLAEKAGNADAAA